MPALNIGIDWLRWAHGLMECWSNDRSDFWIDKNMNVVLVREASTAQELRNRQRAGREGEAPVAQAPRVFAATGMKK